MNQPATKRPRARAGEADAVETQRVTLACDDGVEIAARLYLGRSDDGEPLPVTTTVLIAPAMGVPQTFYGGFARHLARRGLSVLTLDYRGIGDSRRGPLRGSPIELADWGRQDLRAGIEMLRESWPDADLAWVGHSVGGQLLGLAGDSRVDRALLVAAQSGHWRLWTGLDRFKMLALWYGLIPALVPLAGRLPGKVLGGGDDIPPRVARQWARWGRDRAYIESWARQQAQHGFDAFRGPLRAYGFTDDPLAPKRAIEALVGGFDHATTEVTVVAPVERGMKRIGHFGAFRRHARTALWPELADWLVDGPVASRAPA